MGSDTQDTQDGRVGASAVGPVDPKAIDALANHSRQLDEAGEFVAVSREALSLLLAWYYLTEARGEA